MGDRPPPGLSLSPLAGPEPQAGDAGISKTSDASLGLWHEGCEVGESWLCRRCVTRLAGGLAGKAPDSELKRLRWDCCALHLPHGHRPPEQRRRGLFGPPPFPRPAHITSPSPSPGPSISVLVASARPRSAPSPPGLAQRQPLGSKPQASGNPNSVPLPPAWTDRGPGAWRSCSRSPSSSTCPWGRLPPGCRPRTLCLVLQGLIELIHIQGPPGLTGPAVGWALGLPRPS